VEILQSSADTIVLSGASGCQYASGQTYVNYKYDVRSALDYLLRLRLADMADPLGLSGTIHAGYQSEIQPSLAKLQEASAWAARALDAERNGQIENAFGCWSRVFNGQFPAYY
jgi:hypothetical protein